MLSRLWSKVDASGDCWEWMAYRDANGYGWFRYAGKNTTAHRAVWAELVGPIPAGLHLDHLCRNPGCVNPDHLEPVTVATNVRRGVAGVRTGGLARNRTHCPNGHEYTPDNVIEYGPRRYRKCRTCTNASQRRCYANRMRRKKLGRAECND